MISFYVFFACVRKDSKENIYKVYKKLNESEIKDLMGWRVCDRGEGIIMIIYYDQLDSSKYEYYKSGKVHPFTRYASIGFGINNSFDSLYYFRNDTTMNFKSGLILLSKLSRKSVFELDKEIRSNFALYEKYNLPQIAGYPWSNSYYFEISPVTKIIRIDEFKDSMNIVNKGYVSINSNWWYQIKSKN